MPTLAGASAKPVPPLRGWGFWMGGPPPGAHAPGYGTDAPTGLSVAGWHAHARPDPSSAGWHAHARPDPSAPGGMPTLGPTRQRRVACPRSRGHVLAMRGGRHHMATQVWPCHPSWEGLHGMKTAWAQPTSRADVWPSWSPEGWRLFDSQCESKSRAWWFGPALCLRQKAATRRFPGPYHRHPDRRAEGPEWRDPFEQCFHKAPDAEPQHAHPWG